LHPGILRGSAHRRSVGQVPFLGEFEKAWPIGGEAEFYVTDPPNIRRSLRTWFSGAATRNLKNGSRSTASKFAPINGQVECSPGDSRFRSPCRRWQRRGVARSGHADRRRLDSGVPHIGRLQEGDNPLGWLPLARKGRWEWSASIHFRKSIRRTNGQRSIRCSTACLAGPEWTSRSTARSFQTGGIGNKRYPRSRWPGLRNSASENVIRS